MRSKRGSVGYIYGEYPRAREYIGLGGIGGRKEKILQKVKKNLQNSSFPIDKREKE